MLENSTIGGWFTCWLDAIFKSIWVFNSQKDKKEKMQSHWVLNLKFVGKSIKFEFVCGFGIGFGFELDKCFKRLRFRHANLWFDSENFPLLRFIQKRNTKKFSKSSTLATLVLGIFPPYICMWSCKYLGASGTLSGQVNNPIGPIEQQSKWKLQSKLCTNFILIDYENCTVHWERRTGRKGGHKNSNSIENIQFKFGFAVFMHTHIDLDLWTDFYCNAQFVVCFYYCCRSNSLAFHRMPPIPFPFVILISFPISIWLRAIIVNRFHTSIASLYYKQILCYQTSEKKPLE